MSSYDRSLGSVSTAALEDQLGYMGIGGGRFQQKHKEHITMIVSNVPCADFFFFLFYFTSLITPNTDLSHPFTGGICIAHFHYRGSEKQLCSALLIKYVFLKSNKNTNTSPRHTYGFHKGPCGHRRIAATSKH